MAKHPYTPQWRAKVRAGAQASAAVLAPLLHARFAPTSMVDVGAGEGWFAEAFGELGVHTTKVDGPWVDDVITVDLSNPPYPDLPEHDLALCLEAAEHVERDAAGDLVEWLCSLAPVVVFSAAIPGQGGDGHVNEQPPGYWTDLFHQHGYAGSGALRWEIWNDPGVEPWYAQNLLVFGAHDLPADGCPYVIHPGIWSVYR